MTNPVDINRFFDHFDETRKQASVDAVFGTAIESNGRIVIPIASAAYGFGGGVGAQGSDDNHSNVGAGGGSGYFVKPVAVAVIDQNGVRVDPIINEERIRIAGMMLGAWMLFWLGRVLLRLIPRR